MNVGFPSAGWMPVSDRMAAVLRWGDAIALKEAAGASTDPTSDEVEQSGIATQIGNT